MEYRTTIKDLPGDVRPRERLATHGPQALSNIELLAILLRTGNDQETALEVAQRLLAGGGLAFLARASVQELRESFRGVGLAKACQIKAAIELGRRVALAGDQHLTIGSPQEVADLVMEEMRHLDREHFRAVVLGTKNQVLAVEPVSVGTLNSSLVHPREVFKAAIRHNAAALILVHNHPSGDPFPSHDDATVTTRLVEAGKILGIEILDHVVIGDRCYVSFKEQGLI